jgi:single-strand DNA-binding protein
MSVNKAILLGYLGGDPEIRYTPGGDQVTTFTLATTERWRDKSGANQEKTSWHRVTAWQRQAEIAGEYLKKGSPVYIEGRINYREYTDKEGIKKWSTDIVVEKLQLLGKKSDTERSEPPREPTSAPDSGKSQELLDEDIPF